MSEKTRLTWTDIEKDTDNLVSKIKASGKEYDCILGIANGGLVPTCIIAKALQLKNVLTVSLKSYIDEYAHDVQFITSINWSDLKGRKRILVIDDLIDRGETIYEVEKILGYLKYKHKLAYEFDTAVLYLKKNDSYEPRVIPTYYSEIKDPKTWLVFPWE
jgi:hypoxanthine phosphoribosyltransferase|tara:strand:- start:986 stop:1465 length:480 start_codon:yes stop_codon:yes gene_type:complete